ncbi:TrmH family RNA methyltransferase [Estrella lausannensis]|uniref:rRNA methylase, SpoU family n=1 Tax=Estrella lausannensis TaxID=483423 RepID=A0A0H5DN10_9BACT|nr:RNA methyltransferase [Estrella lausannensis]CRX37432.1 rRNA methylase, SpoU family [Estrella lausannensis]
MREITSPANPLIIDLVKIRDDPKRRRRLNQILIEGVKLIEDIRALMPLLKVFSTKEKWLEAFAAEESYLISDAVLKKITATDNPEGVVALVPMPSIPLPEKITRLLVLDRLQDPGNVGVLMRSAFALSWDAVFFLSGTADPFNDKAVRAAKGATFRLPMVKGDFSKLQEIMSEHHLQLLAADMHGEPLAQGNVPDSHIALALGNEGAGLSKEMVDSALKVSIPMREGAESLNVASSGAILMYELSGRA